MSSARLAMLMRVRVARILQQIARIRLQILVATFARIFARYRCEFCTALWLLVHAVIAWCYLLQGQRR